MAMETSGIMPVMDMNRGYDYDGSNNWWWIIIIFALLGWGNRGDQGCVTPTQMQNGFDTTQIMGKLDGIQQSVTAGLCDGFYAQNTNTLNGFAAAQNTMAQGFAGLNTAIIENRYAVGGQIADLGFAVKDCCCTTNRNIDSLRYDAAINTNTIVSALHDEGEKTRAMIKDQEVNALRDELNQARGVISNTVQTNSILERLGTYYTNPPCYGNSCGCNC